MNTTNRIYWVASLAAAVFVAGCSSATPGDRAAGDANPATSATTADDGEDGLGDDSATTPAQGADLTKADFRLTVKITEKKCYGSAGCNVSYRIVPSVDKAKLTASGRDWLVTYQVSGVEDGPDIASFTLQQDGSYESYDMEGDASTSNRSKVLTVKVTEVEAQ